MYSRGTRESDGSLAVPVLFVEPLFKPNASGSQRAKASAGSTNKTGTARDLSELRGAMRGILA
jgi:hypothetical protein